MANLFEQTLFAITPLNWVEWKAVLLISAPVLVIDEVLKFITVRPSFGFFPGHPVHGLQS